AGAAASSAGATAGTGLESMTLQRTAITTGHVAEKVFEKVVENKLQEIWKPIENDILTKVQQMFDTILQGIFGRDWLYNGGTSTMVGSSHDLSKGQNLNTLFVQLLAVKNNDIADVKNEIEGIINNSINTETDLTLFMSKGLKDSFSQYFKPTLDAGIEHGSGAVLGKRASEKRLAAQDQKEEDADREEQEDKDYEEEMKAQQQYLNEKERGGLDINSQAEKKIQEEEKEIAALEKRHGGAQEESKGTKNWSKQWKKYYKTGGQVLAGLQLVTSWRRIVQQTLIGFQERLATQVDLAKLTERTAGRLGKRKMP
ncbi:unnamed protein product, partial [Amoebophrya sp. A120]